MNARHSRRTPFRWQLGAASTLLAAGLLLPLPSTAGETSDRPVRTAPTVFINPNGSDSGRCDKSQPCRSFDRAYRVARPGQVVEVAAGSYPPQVLTFDPAKTSEDDVIFEPAPGATPTFPGSDSMNLGRINFKGPQHLTLRGFAIPDLGLAHAVHVNLVSLDVGLLNVNSSQNVTIRGGDYGPWVDGISQIRTCEGDAIQCTAENIPSNNVVIEGARFHDYTISDPANHSECIQTQGIVNNLTIRNSVFERCTDFGILFDSGGKGLLIENSFFDEPMPGETATVACVPGCPRGGNSIRIENRGSPSNITIQYNTALGGIAVDDDPPGTPPNTLIRGNIGDKRQCQSGQTFAYNVWSNARCGPGDRTASLSSLFVDGDPSDGSMNLHLRAGSAAIDHGDPKNFPARDIDGQPRPQRWAPDAGADQRESVIIRLGKSIGSVEIGMSERAVVDFYGRPRRVTSKRLGDDKHLVRLALYRVHGGRLQVTYRAGRVVGVAATSTYYSTRTGLGPGADFARSRLVHFRWDECLRVYRRYIGGVAVDVRPAGGRKTARSTAISMLKRGYEKC